LITGGSTLLNEVQFTLH